MPEIAYPAASSHFSAFRDRIRRSPSATVDVEWLMSNLDITQERNAQTTLRWIKIAGFIGDDGRLTPRGQELLGNEGGESYHRAAEEALRAVAGDDLIESIQAGTVTKDSISGHMQRRYGAGEAVIQALSGLRELANAAAVPEVQAVFGESRRKTDAPGRRPERAAGKRPKRESNEDNGSERDLSDGAKEANNIRRNSSGTLVLTSGVLNVSIDGTWSIENIRATLIMLQQIERGVPINEGVSPNGFDHSFSEVNTQGA